MNYLTLANGAIVASDISLGCMRINALDAAQAERLVKTAIDCGINFFDHADIYGGGKSEEVFAAAAALTPATRETLYLQSKCGIRGGFFDFSKEHILASVDASLARLKTDYLDALLLHRPDTLMEPEEVATAFDQLHRAGKVRHFGVSNQKSAQIELLRAYCDQPLIFNQLQFSIMHTGMIDSGINVNMTVDGSSDRDGEILEYCRLNHITIQAWSPFQFGFFGGVFLDNAKFPELNAKIDEIAASKGVSNNAIAVAWILRHPAKMQVIVGTTNPERLAATCKGSDVKLTREEWYAIYRAAGNKLP